MSRDPCEIRHLLPVAVPVPPPAHVATRDHVCGNCRQPGTNMGSTACRNYRPSQTVPYVDPDALKEA